MKSNPELSMAVIVALVISLSAGAASLVLGGFIDLRHLVQPGALWVLADLPGLPVKAQQGEGRARVVVIAGWAATSLGCWFTRHTTV